MDEELKRLEEKQKLTNLQIDKRLSTIEIFLEELKGQFENLSTLQDLNAQMEQFSRDFHNLKEEIVNLKLERKKDLEQLNSMTQSFDMSVLTDIRELKNTIDILRSQIEDKVKYLESMQQQLIGLEERGKLPQCDTQFKRIFSNLNSLVDRIDTIQKRLDILEKNFIAKKIFEPIILE